MESLQLAPPCSVRDPGLVDLGRDRQRILATGFGVGVELAFSSGVDAVCWVLSRLHDTYIHDVGKHSMFPLEYDAEVLEELLLAL